MAGPEETGDPKRTEELGETVDGGGVWGDSLSRDSNFIENARKERADELEDDSEDELFGSDLAESNEDGWYSSFCEDNQAFDINEWMEYDETKAKKEYEEIQQETFTKICNKEKRHEKLTDDDHCFLGQWYENGLYGATQDPEKSFTHYEQAAKQGNADAQYRLGQAYENKVWGKADALVEQISESDGVELKKSMMNFYAGVKENNAEAKWRYGFYLAQGTGVEEADFLEGVDLMMQAAESGSKMAAYNLYKIYRPIEDGVFPKFGKFPDDKKDAKKAVHWLEVAENNGYEPTIKEIKFLDAHSEKSALPEDDFGLD